jgi:hypothetical protein
MADFSSPDQIQKLRGRLRDIRLDFADFEEEELTLYPFVSENIQRAGVALSKDSMVNGQ